MLLLKRTTTVQLLCLSFSCLYFMACQDYSRNNRSMANAGSAIDKNETSRDIHSYANPEQVRVSHVHLDLDVDFDRKALKGSSTLTLERVIAGNHPLKLDTRDLKIIKAEASSDGSVFVPAQFNMGATDKILGAPLSVQLPEKVSKVRIEYETSPNASGVQWLDPRQTAGKKYPYMFTQSEAIPARSWIPLQDSPALRITYSAVIHTPRNLRAVMSAEQIPYDGPVEVGQGGYSFKMPQAIPSYLIALAV